MAMVNFDQNLLYTTYNNLLQEKTFKEIFYEVFIPFLSELGILWQTDTITPAHEHFVSTFIKQKILVNTEKIQNIEPLDSPKTFVLFLPDNEIHDIGLLFINYELTSRGHKTIFLGQSVPVNSLKDLQKFYKEIIFVSYFTIKPEPEQISNYLNEFQKNIINGHKAKLYILGRALHGTEKTAVPSDITMYDSIESLVKDL